jgi:hypothetical protein
MVGRVMLQDVHAHNNSQDAHVAAAAGKAYHRQRTFNATLCMRMQASRDFGARVKA